MIGLIGLIGLIGEPMGARRFALSIKRLLVLVAMFAIELGCLSSYVRYERWKFRRECLHELDRSGFLVDEETQTVYLQGNTANTPIIDGSTAIAMVAVTQRYRIEVSGCRITDQATTIIRSMEKQSKEVIVEDCELIPE